MRVRREVAAAVAAVVLAACGAAAAGSSTASHTGDVATTAAPAAAPATAPAAAASTVSGVGVLPSENEGTGSAPPARDDRNPTDDPVTTLDDDATDESAGPTSTPGPRRPRSASNSTAVTVEPIVPLGERVTGNRVLMIGDSILASTSRRHGNNMCRALVPLGWQVEIEAEVSREITFGNRVLRSRMPAGWDAAVILLGNNYGQNPNLFMAELNTMLSTLEPRPVLLLTVTEFEPIQREVNDIIRAVAALYPNVTVVDWATVSRFPGVLSGDGLHLTDNGREFLALQLLPYFGPAPVQPGACLSSSFHDDSAGSVDGPPSTSRPSGNRPPATVRPTATTSRPSVTTARTVVTTATAATTATTASTRLPGGAVTTGPVSASTSPPLTNPPQTNPPLTSPSPPQTNPPLTSPSPPQTSPPQTSPPATSPPQTSPPQTSPPATSPPPTSPPATSPPPTSPSG